MEVEITDPKIEHYIEHLYPLEDPILREMESLGKEIGFPIIGPLVGRLLYQLTKMISAKKVFELGSGFGYSAFWFSLALPEDGSVHLTDNSKKNLDRARKFFVQGNLVHKATFSSGNAISILEKTDGPFDIIFMDIDKESYPKAVPLIKSKLRVGGILITDNLLWLGRVLESKGSDSTEAIKRYNQTLFNDCDFVSTLLPIRDGVGVSFRIQS
jgi:caffeoyl-CoA O-methyltransferase